MYKKETIQHNVESYKGISVEGIKQLTKKQLVVANAWYFEYKNPESKVTKEEVKNLLEVLENPLFHDLHVLETNPPLKLPILLEAAKGYVEIAKEFPENNREAYWKSVISNLKTFLKNAT